MTQKERIKEYLDSGRELTRLNSWENLGIIELPARLSELKQGGYQFDVSRRTITNRYGEKTSIAVYRRAGLNC